MAIDLHIHSTASDGAYTPAQIVRMAAAAGISRMALTDHDSVDGVAEAIQAGADEAITVIPGVELSAETTDGRAAHILGYFVDDRDENLRSRLSQLRDARLTRARQMVAALADAGVPITLDDVIGRAGSGAVGRAHIAMVLVDAGVVPTISTAFNELIGRDRPYYVAKPVATPEAVIGTIISAGGLPVCAHPAVSGIEDLLPAMADAGLEGLEAYHSQHDTATRRRLESTARELGLIVTGGSDFHGIRGSHAALGDGGTPDAVYDALVERAGARALGQGR